MTARSLLLIAIPFSLACGGDSFTSPDDGGADAFDGSATDAIPDTRSDVITPIDAGGDAVTIDAGWVAPPPLNCANAPPDAVFCADFDTNVDAAQGWKAPFVQNGTLTSDTTNFYSAARSLKAVANAGFPAYAELFEDYLDSNAHANLALSFAFRVASTDTTVKVRVAELSYFAATAPSGNVRYDVVVGAGAAVTLITTTPAPDAGVSTTSFALGTYTIGVWHHVSLELKVTAPVKVNVELDGAKQTFSPGLPAADTNLKVRNITAGAHALTSLSSSATMNVDDVLLRAF